MENMMIDQLSQVLGTTLLHSLWQALVMYALLRIFLACFPSATSAQKYTAGLISLAGSVAWPIVTFIIELSKHTFIQPIADAGNDILPFIPLHHAAIAAHPVTPSFNIETYFPYLVAFWLIGIAINSAKLLWGWRNIYQVKQNVISSPVLESSIQKLSQLLKMKTKVVAYLSDHVDVPCIIGYFKPMIILPAAVVTQFTPEQIRSILVHEMAHIRRNDYLVNVLQQLVGILFFFNPFTLLINRIIYAEREHCCDDLVLQVTGEPLVYAQTLLQLEESRSQQWQLAIAATGKKYHLLTRIKRIMETKKQANNFRHVLLAVLLLTGSMGTIAWLNPEIKDGKIMVKPVSLPSILNNDVADTTKKVTTKKTAKHTGTYTAKEQLALKEKMRKGGMASIQYDDPKLEKLSAEVEKRGEAIGKIYESPVYKNLENAMQQRSAIIDSFYNRPELKNLQKQLDEQSAALDKMSDNPEMKATEKQMEELGKTMDKYYKSDEYKRLEKIMELQAKLLAEDNGLKGPEYDKQREAYKKANDDYRAYLNSPEMKKAQEDLREEGKKMHDYYSSDAYKSQRDAMTKVSEQLREMYKSPMIKEQTAEMKKIGEQMRAYANSPQMAKTKAELKKAQEALNAYRNSPEFKKHQAKIQAELNELKKGALTHVVPDTTSSGK